MWSSELHFVKVQFTKPFFVRESEYNDKVMEMGKILTNTTLYFNKRIK